MAGDGIYRKTEKGRTEIATRANRLGMRERTMLIMVDDKTTRSGLLAKNAHPTSEGILNNLLADGYIEIVGGGGSGTAETSASPTGAPLASAAPTGGQPAVEVSLTSASRYACRTLMNYLGPSADDLTAMVEKAKGAAELATALEKCRQIVQSIAGKQKADEFWSGVSVRLPRA
jgi:DNA-binding PadR family transcriptional regulator